MRLAPFALLLPLVWAAAPPAQRPLDPPPVPPENPMSADKVLLGKALFWDEQLSATKTVACATCHLPEAGGSDPRRGAVHPGLDGLFATDDDVHGSFGVVFMEPVGTYAWEPDFGLSPQVTRRRAPSVLMAAYEAELFWDGRAPQQLFDPLTRELVIPQGAALERQSLVPLLSEVEMTQSGTEWPHVIARVREARPLALAEQVPAELDHWLGDATYPRLFARAFGTPAVTPVRIAMALASYQRALVPNAAPIDRFLAGDRHALTALERRGFAVFTDVGCARCHPAPVFANGGFFNVGVRPALEDPGRGAITRAPHDQGAFKVPSLRNLALRAPYFHDGSHETLAEVVAFYDRGGDFAENRSPLIQPLGLTRSQTRALLAFLDRPLVDPRVAAGAPPFDHPRLFAASARAPSPYGTGTAGAGGRIPAILAAEPPLAGNSSFRMALTDGLAGAPAVVLLDAAPGRRPLLGVEIVVGLTPVLQVLPLAPLLHGSGAGDGWTSWSLMLPPDPGWADTELFAQALVLDAAGPRGLSASAGVRWRVFAGR